MCSLSVKLWFYINYLSEGILHVYADEVEMMQSVCVCCLSLNNGLILINYLKEFCVYMLMKVK